MAGDNQASPNAALFDHEPDPEHPGWRKWDVVDDRRFNAQVIGKINVRDEDGGRVRVRMYPDIKHTNLLDFLHGATILSLIDIAIFACGHTKGLEGMPGAVTLDLSTQFIGGGKPGTPLDAVVELLRETNRLVFVRGLVEQDESLIAAFSATIRKARRA